MQKTRLLFLLALLIAGLLLPIGWLRAQENSPVSVTGKTADARDLITQAMAAYRQSQFQNAYKLARAAYLDYFEDAEPPLRALNRDLTLDMEYRFADLRSKMQLRRPPEEVEASVASVRSGLIEIDALFDESGARLAPAIAFSSSFVIAIREGLEAMLILGVVLGALRASNTRRMGRYVLMGAAAAVLISLLVWAALHSFLSAVPVAQQVVSALASVLAVVMLVWVNIWVLRRADQRYWMETMSARAWAAMASGSAIGLVLLGFSSFFRQGLETALLYEVLIGYSQRVEVYLLLGAAVALIVMIGGAWLFARAGRAISLAAFLKIATPLLMLLSVAFIGGAVAQLQESGYFPVTSAIKLVPRLPYFIASMTGIHPTYETLGAQLILIAIYVVLLIWLRGRRPAAQPAVVRT